MKHLGYIADFLCLNPRLIIEIDGGQHSIAEHQTYDKKRTDYLQNKGYKVLRFWNREVNLHIESVMEAIFNEIV